MPHSHHSHSGRFCAHAAPDTSPGSMLARAHAAGFDTYHLTEHVPRRCASQLYPEEAAAGLDPAALQCRFEDYLVEARACQAEWAARGLNVLVGAETEWMEDEGDWWPFLSRVLGEAAEGGASDPTVAAPNSSSSSSRSRSKVDFVVGSLHHVHDVPIDFDTATFDKALERYYQGEAGPGQRRKAHLALATDYLEAQYRMLVAVRPEVVGHFDLFRLFDAELSLSETDGDDGGSSSSSGSVSKEESKEVRVVRELAWRNICFAASYGALFEINAASVRKGWKSPYPGEEILDMILQAKGRVCLSDDAHAHQQIGLNYHVARDYLCRKGVDAVWDLERDGTVAGEDFDGEEKEERERRTRELSSTPGQDAPTRFRRGARSRRVSDWSTKTSFWSNYPPQKSQIQPQ